MAIVFTEGDRARVLSPDAKNLYEAIVHQDWGLVDVLDKQKPGARPELLALGLISDEYPPVARDPQQAVRTKFTTDIEQVTQLIGAIAQLPDLARELGQDYHAAQLRAGGGSSVYLPDPATVNARLQDVVGSARREILAAQPGGPRKREVLEAAVSRDTQALDRGVRMRTIYLDSVRDHTPTAEYVRALSARGSGRPARYTTLPGDFERMVIVDREAAFVSDYIVAGSNPHSAWMVTDPAMVAVLAKMFDAKWRRAQPWSGELRSRTGLGVDTVSGADGVRTDRRQRGILRFLCAGKSQETTAKEMRVSKRKLQEEITVMKSLWGVGTLNELIFQWASSPDRYVDDSAPDTDAAGAEDAEDEEAAA